MDSAVVTGAARGIGRGIAELLVARGYAVVVTDLDGDAARRTAAEVGAVAGLAQDVRDEASHAAVAAEALRHGRLAVWVNNAGVGFDGTLAERQLRSTSTRSSTSTSRACCGACGPRSRPSGPAGGDVVNVASASGLGPVPGLAVYAATKAAVVSVTMSAQRRDAATGPGARAVPRRRRHRDGRGDATRRPGARRWCTRAAGC